MPEKAYGLPKLAAPAQRALAAAGISDLLQLSRMTEKELLQFHGIGPNAIKTLQLALAAQCLAFLPE